MAALARARLPAWALRGPLGRGGRPPCARTFAVTPAAAGSSAELVTDATFRYRKFDWQTSRGDVFEYQYVVAQQPAGGATARSALAAAEEALPRPPSGWSLVLIPSVSLVCSGKEEMRPLATLLSQQGHRCYVLEWPGWTVDVQINFSMARCKLEELSGELEDFWCQALEHVALSEIEEAQAAPGTAEPAAAAAAAPRLCVIGAGHAAAYAVRALRRLQEWAPSADSSGGGPAVAAAYRGLAAVAPTWRTRRRGPAARLPPHLAAAALGSWLHSDSRFARPAKSAHFSGWRLRRHFPHRGSPEAARLEPLAKWLFRRQRPYAQTDGAALHGLLDPSFDGDATDEAFAEEAAGVGRGLAHGLLLLAPADSPPGALAALAEGRGGAVELAHVAAPGPLPHEARPAAVQAALDPWLARTCEQAAPE